MALYDIYKLEVKVQHNNVRNTFKIVDREKVDVTAYADNLLIEKEAFIIDTMISMGHLSNKASTDNIDIMYHLATSGGIADSIRLQDKRTGYPLFWIAKRNTD